MTYFKHDEALVESDKIGDNTRIWAYAHVLPGATIGSDCNICDHVFIENDVIIGDRVTIKCGVQVWDGLRIEDDAFIGPNATFTNDAFPRSKKYPEKFLPTVICKGASIGANATILAGLTIGKNAMVGAGSVVTRNVPPNAIVIGNPAHIKGYVSSPMYVDPAQSEVSKAPAGPTPGFHVRGVTLYNLPFIDDIRGCLTFAEVGQFLPFDPKRFFLVFDVPSREVRGEHAHKELHQFLVCVKGSCSIVVDDSIHREEIRLDSPNVGIHVGPMVWSTQYKYSSDAVLMVLASDVYKAEDYIRDYDEFLDLKG